VRAIRVHRYGGPEVLEYEEVPVPDPGPGEALVHIAASGVNFIDVYHRQGRYPTPLPFTPGTEAAGVVEKVGPDVREVAAGARVAYAMQLGSYARYAVVPERLLVTVPPGVDDRSAAAAMLQGMTAHYLTRSTYPIRSGDTVLVHAAAGGMGLLLCQLAKRAGARVIGTVSTEEKAALARGAGADETILYSRADFEAETRRLTNGRGVDVVYDGVGRTTFEKSLGSLRTRGTMVLYGAASGPVPPVDLQILNAKGSLYVTRPTLGHYTADRAELISRAGDVLRWVADGELRLTIGGTYPLADAARAHHDLEGRASVGKLLLLPG
jgi:NADPH2:quinone reductase